MHGFDTQRLVVAATLLATALFLMSGAPGLRYRRQVRIAAIAVYGAALAGVVVWVLLWLVDAA
ncbi:MAG TPA: hypothetical protein VM782_05315 [Stellaceae bacterium]|nr:hypothetical protein [Stellaceae bacterium]